MASMNRIVLVSIHGKWYPDRISLSHAHLYSWKDFVFLLANSQIEAATNESHLDENALKFLQFEVLNQDWI